MISNFKDQVFEKLIAMENQDLVKIEDQFVAELLALEKLGHYILDFRCRVDWDTVQSRLVVISEKNGWYWKSITLTTIGQVNRITVGLGQIESALRELDKCHD